jgi:hypothetical protein
MANTAIQRHLGAPRAGTVSQTQPFSKREPKGSEQPITRPTFSASFGIQPA